MVLLNGALYYDTNQISIPNRDSVAINSLLKIS